MEINITNKLLYEEAFIENGEYGYHGRNWNPSIDENQISEWSGDDEGHYVPATPLGYRDYKISRLEGLQNIINQEEAVDLRNDELHNVVKESGRIKLYDKLITDNGAFVVVGEVDDRFFVADINDNRYYVEYAKPTEDAKPTEE